MNKKQLITMWIGIGIIVSTTLFPMTKITTFKDEYKDLENHMSVAGVEAKQRKGYNLFQENVTPLFLLSDKGMKTEIQYSKMFLCHFVIALVTGGLIVTLNKKKVS